MTHDGNRDPRAAAWCLPLSRNDRWCVIAVFTDDEWRALCRVANHPEWAKDPRFATFAARKQNEDALDCVISEWTRQFTPHEVMEKLQAVGVQAGVVNTLGDLFSDPQLEHRRIWRELPHAELERFHYEAPPFSLSETPAEQFPSPLLGEHNQYVLHEILGMPDAEIEELTRQGVVE
jgi:crotonobetainyl-CoA:carnitine CoA-transferase CaiB-like acyl-CoA transferase